jgi:GT2 family glycosyltransferase
VNQPEATNRAAVTVVMPFAGTPADALAARGALGSLELGPEDRLILVDNSAVATGLQAQDGRVQVLRATREHSAAHARNLGAAEASTEWILFLDADCRPKPDLVDAYFRQPVAPDVGALAGEVVGDLGVASVVGRYGAARNFLGQRAHMDHPYRPRAAAANLLVRRAAFEQVGGFYEGLRAAEDTDFAWRLQQAGWRLELRADASVVHAYRTTLGQLRRQWRSYAAGRAWLARRYRGFEPQPAVVRALARVRTRAAGRRPPPRGALTSRGPDTATPAPRQMPDPPDRPGFLALDALLSLEELVGFALSNRPGGAPPPGFRPDVILVAERFPSRGDPLVELAAAVDRADVVALARPQAPDLHPPPGLRITYLEDDGWAARMVAVGRLGLSHPLRCLADRRRRRTDEPSLLVLAPAVLALQRNPGARVQALGGDRARALAWRLADLAGRPWEG